MQVRCPAIPMAEKHVSACPNSKPSAHYTSVLYSALSMVGIYVVSFIFASVSRNVEKQQLSQQCKVARPFSPSLPQLRKVGVVEGFGRRQPTRRVIAQ